MDFQYRQLLNMVSRQSLMIILKFQRLDLSSETRKIDLLSFPLFFSHLLLSWLLLRGLLPCTKGWKEVLSFAVTLSSQPSSGSFPTVLLLRSEGLRFLQILSPVAGEAIPCCALCSGVFNRHVHYVYSLVKSWLLPMRCVSDQSKGKWLGLCPALICQHRSILKDGTAPGSSAFLRSGPGRAEDGPSTAH